MTKQFSDNIPQVVLGAAYELWSMAIESSTGLLVWCPNTQQAMQIRKRMYQVRSNERRKGTRDDEFGVPIPGRTAWDNLGIYHCYDPSYPGFDILMAEYGEARLIPKALRVPIPRFLWIGTAALIFEGVKIYNPTTGELLKDFEDFPKIPPRVLDNLYEPE